MAEEIVQLGEYIGKEATTKVSYNRRDLIVYATGIGCTELHFVYENDTDFAAFPTFPFVLPFKGTEQDVVSFPSETMMESNVSPGLPGSKFVLDGERFIEILHPLPTEPAEFNLVTKLVGVHKKGKGALTEVEQRLEDNSGKVFVRMISGAFYVGAKNFQPEQAGQTYSQNVPVPNRNADKVVEMAVPRNQAQVYRLSGDYNPLHVDPMMAQMNGFKEPILHGLCTLGHAARAVLQAYGDNDPERFKSIKCRFASPVLPGNTLVTEMWEEGSRVIYRTKVKESNKTVISNAYVELKPASKL
eukprot:CAMPEP_0119135034 /NCGR_PEP_ID=MMETSP1310-20130426/18511_1 /TAXON_ID=464262 /ORGANISM="Genus nov. species nov., Strain RCC2339" /LENGTH=300 /DNA_ID=CAMNT_0007125885 /DNA_START=62 /DNA_END=964 /DNA_ORIENTATION=+